jgi:cell wall-associated NlpC family hydrolase
MLFNNVDQDEERLLLKFMAIPYKHRGRCFDGADCYGLEILWYRHRYGIELFDLEEDYDVPGRWGDRSYILENYYRQWTKTDHPEPGDLIIFNRYQQADHVGVCLTNGRFMHMMRCGVVIGRLLDKEWSNIVEGYYRFKGKR